MKFDSGQLQRVAKKVEIAGPELSPSAKTLEKAEQLYTDNDLKPAKDQFLKALQQKGADSEHAQAWYGLVLPSSTPREIVARLNVEAVKGANSKEFRERMEPLGFEVVTSTP